MKVVERNILKHKREKLGMFPFYASLEFKYLKLDTNF